jgi:ribonucleoside-diphosphate reductase alpha chain
MALGEPYDSDVGRSYAAAISALMTGHAYATSAAIAERTGPFEAYELNSAPMLRVMEQHRQAAYNIDSPQPELSGSNLSELLTSARAAWDSAVELGRVHGYRNAQTTVIAPTGTIAFMMDCDTTGIEPDIALVKYKKLVGGGMMRIVNNTVPLALRRLGYDEKKVSEIVDYIDENGTIEGVMSIRDEHLPVFDCAFRPENGQRSIDYMGHIKMMGAVQPFVSGAISKTVNLPQEASAEEIMTAYIEAWKHGVKAIAIYRDGSKKVQPLSTASSDDTSRQTEVHAQRRPMPDTRASLTHKFKLEGHTGYITVGLYEDGSPGEIFISMAKQGSTIYGLMESFGRSISYALQYGVPLGDLVRNFSHMRFEPSGMTSNPEIPFAQSVIDYLFRWLASQFLAADEVEALGILTPEVKQRMIERLETNGHGTNGDAPDGNIVESPAYVVATGVARSNGQADAPACANCGWIMMRSGTCYRCENCGSTSGCS